MRKFLFLLMFLSVFGYAASAEAVVCTAKEIAPVLADCNSTCRAPNTCFANYKTCTASCVSQENKQSLEDWYQRHPDEYSGKPADEKYDEYNASRNNLPGQIEKMKQQQQQNTTTTPTPTPANNNGGRSGGGGNSAGRNRGDNSGGNSGNSGGNDSLSADFMNSIAFNPPEIERNTGTPNNNSGGSTNALGIDFSQNSPDVNRAKELIGGAVPNAGDLLGGGSSNSPVNLANQSVEGGQSGGGNKGGATQPAGSSVSGKVEQSSFTGASSLNEDYGMGSCSSGNIFQQLACRAGTIGSGLKSVAYMIAGFGLIVFSFAAIFGKVKWPLFATIMFSCFLLSATVFVINMMTKSGDASWIGGIKSNGSSYSASTAPAGNIDSNEVSKTDS
jgi:hypothetical protein